MVKAKVLPALLVLLLVGCVSSPNDESVTPSVTASGTLQSSMRRNTASAAYFLIPIKSGSAPAPHTISVLVSQDVSGSEWIVPAYSVVVQEFQVEVRIMDAGYLNWHYHIVADF